MNGTTQMEAPKLSHQPSAEEIHRRQMLPPVHTEENFGKAIIVGLAAAVAGSLAWMAITYFTGYQIGWMAVGVGFLVGVAIKWAGHGTSPAFGFLGAGLALFGCLLGNLLTACIQIAEQEQVSVGTVLGALTPEFIAEIFSVTFHPMDILFYGLAIYWGYKYSFESASAPKKAA